MPVVAESGARLAFRTTEPGARHQHEMLFDAAAWALIIAMACVAGAGVLHALRANHLRAGDRAILAAWIGVVVIGIALLAVSIFVPLSPGAGILTAAVLAALGGWQLARARRRHRGDPRASAMIPRAAVVAGIVIVTLGAAALASDRVTLYDSLVYHVGIQQWLREHGTVPGVALIHNRLGHVSAWFTLSAPFDAGPARHRAANVALGVALVLVALQGALALARVAARRANDADWFLLLASGALVWAGVWYRAATPSPDVAANALIVVVAWSMLVAGRAGAAHARAGWARWLGPRLVPLVVAVGAMSVKLFALPAAAAAALAYAFGHEGDRGARDLARRAVVCSVLGLVLLAPLVAANLVASGCPLFPSPVACLATPWSVGSAAAADYAAYIRDVARWEYRGGTMEDVGTPWIGAWVAAHPLLAALVVLSVVLGVVLLWRPRHDGVRPASLMAIAGIAFAAWQAPAPRFLYAFVIIVPALAVAGVVDARWKRRSVPSTDARPAGPRLRAASVGFIGFSLAAGAAYAVASQKLNVRSAILAGAQVTPPLAGELVLPALPEEPERLYRWRVNDVDLVTPVPRPVADTLGYRSAIPSDAEFEKCSTAPLPCTPYLPPWDVRLRVRARGPGGGFVRGGRPSLTARGPECVGVLPPPYGPALPGRARRSAVTPAGAGTDVAGSDAACGGRIPR